MVPALGRCRGDYGNRPDSGGFRRSLGPGRFRRRHDNDNYVDNNNDVDYDHVTDNYEGD